MTPANLSKPSGEHLPGVQDGSRAETRQRISLDEDNRLAVTGAVIDLAMRDASLGPDVTQPQTTKHVIDI